MMPLFHASLLLSALGLASGHGAVTFPRARQALDADIACSSQSFKTAAGCKKPTTKIGAGNIGAGCPPRSTIPGGASKPQSNGQACYWFSNGCNIGCDACDGSTPSPGHDDESQQKFLYKGYTKAQLVDKKMTGPEIIAGLWNPNPGDMVLDPHANPKPVIKSTCGKIGKPTLCDRRLRTLNTQAECGSGSNT